MDNQRRLIQSRQDTTPEDLEEFDLFINSLAHRLGNILGTIPFDILIALKALDSNDSDTIREILANIDKGVQEALALMKRVRQAGKPLEVERGDLNELLTGVLNAQSFPANVEIEIRRDKTEALPVMGIEQLHEVFLNLIENAVAAMPDGGVLSIEVDTKDRAGEGHIEVRISDTGIGIPEEVQKRLFKRIFDNRGGHEVGLWLSKKLLQWLGGDICLLQSETGKGTTFFVTVPMAVDDPRS
jgi:two-component system NtrC family sensor kinase